MSAYFCLQLHIVWAIFQFVISILREELRSAQCCIYLFRIVAPRLFASVVLHAVPEVHAAATSPAELKHYLLENNLSYFTYVHKNLSLPVVR